MLISNYTSFLPFKSKDKKLYDDLSKVYVRNEHCGGSAKSCIYSEQSLPYFSHIITADHHHLLKAKLGRTISVKCHITQYKCKSEQKFIRAGEKDIVVPIYCTI